jgi:hypothetical protein
MFFVKPTMKTEPPHSWGEGVIVHYNVPFSRLQEF